MPKPDPSRDVDEQLIIVSVGTDHHRFDRLVRWTDDYMRARSAAHPELRILVQRGTSAPPRRVESEELIPHDQICQLFSEAVAVVSHGGPSTVMDARRAGRLPIVVPRDPDLAEHIDGHQLRFAKHLAQNNMAIVATDQPAFFAALDAALADPSSVAIEPSQDAIPEGVVQFGQVLDGLLGVRTPLETSQGQASE